MKYCLPFLFLLIGFGAFAQQDAQYSQYMFNSMVINPAYAGYRESLNVSMLHRDQWTGLDGAPKTQSFVIDAATGRENRVGLGLSIINDKLGLQRQSSAHVNYAYRLPVGENDSRLSFGLSLGIAQYVLNASDASVGDADDPNFGAAGTYFVPDARFGFHYYNDRFYIGASGTNLLANSINFQQVGNNTIATHGRHYFVTAGALFNLNESMKFKPSFLIKEDTKGPTSMDLNSFVLIKNSVWLGASYRTGVNLWKKTGLNNGTFKQNSLVGVVETFFLDKFRLGYAYDYSLSKIVTSLNGTHEISLGLVLNGKKKSTALLTPRYF